MDGEASPGEVYNLLAPLDDERFDRQAIHHEIEAYDLGGIRVERFHRTPESVLSWIDAEFAGTWSSEAAAGGICIARSAQGFAGFAAFDPRGLRFGWLRAWREQPDVGIFGPFGVGEAARGKGIGRLLLRFAMCSLRERGYARALIPVARAPLGVSYYRREAGAHPVEVVDLSGGRPRRAVVLASGNGTNFQSVIDGSRAPSRPLALDVVGLVCNRPGAFALERAARAGVDAKVVCWNRSEPRSAYDDCVIEAVAAFRPELVLLLGWMHVLPPKFLEWFPEALNVHPAFLPLDPSADEVTMPDGTALPAFRGAHAVDDAWNAGVAWGGASVHRVRVDVDRGEILARAPLQRRAGETKDTFFERLHDLEHRVLATAIRRWTYEHAEHMTHPVARDTTEGNRSETDNTGGHAHRSAR